MDRPEQLTAFQVVLARIFFTLDAAEDYLVAGGGALLASDLIDRPTEDLDLFAAPPTTSVTPAKDAFMRTLHEQGCGVGMIQDGPTFCRKIVDLAIDSPPHIRPTITVLGPTWHHSNSPAGSCSPSSALPRPATSPTSSTRTTFRQRRPH